MRLMYLLLVFSVVLAACSTTVQNFTAPGADVAADVALEDTAAPVDTAKPDVAKDIAKVDVAPAPCKPTDNTGCTEAGTHCGYDDADMVACVKDGTHAIAEDCSDGAGCKVGVCVQNQNGKSLCAPYCLSDLQCNSNSCNKLDGKKGHVCDVGSYTPCDMLAQNCTDKTQGCYDSGANGFVCLQKGSLAQGDLCDQSNQCTVGLACIGASAGSKGVCRKVCAFPNGAPACDSVTIQCTSLLGSNKFGYCPL